MHSVRNFLKVEDPSVKPMDREILYGSIYLGMVMKLYLDGVMH